MVVLTTMKRTIVIYHDSLDLMLQRIIMDVSFVIMIVHIGHHDASVPILSCHRILLPTMIMMMMMMA